MEQKTEASQAVDENSILREALKRISETRFGWDGDCGVTSIAEDALAEADALKAQPAEIDPALLRALKEACDLAMKNTVAARVPECGDFGAIAQNLDYALSQLKAQPAPTEAMPKLVIALPDYERRRLVIASDEMIGGERVICAAIKSAPTEAQVDGLSPVYAWLERSTRNSPAEVANAARTMMAFYQGAEFPEAVQGEDSARLDAMPMWEYYGCTEAEWIEFKAWSKNRARASAETGGVKT